MEYVSNDPRSKEIRETFKKPVSTEKIINTLKEKI